MPRSSSPSSPPPTTPKPKSKPKPSPNRRRALAELRRAEAEILRAAIAEGRLNPHSWDSGYVEGLMAQAEPKVNFPVKKERRAMKERKKGQEKAEREKEKKEKMRVLGGDDLDYEGLLEVRRGIRRNKKLESSAEAED